MADVKLTKPTPYGRVKPLQGENVPVLAFAPTKAAPRGCCEYSRASTTRVTGTNPLAMNCFCVCFVDSLADLVAIIVISTSISKSCNVWDITGNFLSTPNPTIHALGIFLLTTRYRTYLLRVSPLKQQSQPPPRPIDACCSFPFGCRLGFLAASWPPP